MWYILARKYYSALKRNEILIYAPTWMNLENIMLSEISIIQKDTLYDITYMRYLVLEEVIEMTWPSVDPQAVPGQSSSSSLLCPWNVHSTHCSHSWSHFQGCSLERAIYCWDHLDCVRDWSPLRPLFTFLRFWLPGQRSTHLVATKDKPCK